MKRLRKSQFLNIKIWWIFLFVSQLSLADQQIDSQLNLFSLELESSQLSFDISKKYFLPELQLRGNYLTGTQLDSQGFLSQNQFLAIEIKQNIFHSGFDQKNYEIQKIKYQIAKDDYEQNRSAFYLQIIQLNIQYHLALNRFELHQRKLKQADIFFQLIQSQYKSGFKKKEEFLEIESSYRRAKLALLAAEFEVTKNRQQLQNKLLGTGITIQDLNLQKLKQRLMQDQVMQIEPKYSQFEQMTNLQQDLIKSKNTWNFDIDLAAGYGVNDYTSDSSIRQTDNGPFWSIQAELTYPLFDFGLKNQNVKIELIQIEIEKLKERQRIKDRQSQFEQLKSDLRYFNSALEVSHDLLKSETQNQAYFSSQYRQGQMTLTAYLMKMESYFEIEQQAIEIEYQIIKIQSEIIHLTRYLNEKDFIN